MANALSEKVASELRTSQYTRALQFSHSLLLRVPPAIFHGENYQKITRLDISYNKINHFPNELCQLVGLKELWASNNPISAFPSNLQMLVNLEVLDISNTLISEIPSELATLTNLFDLDWRDTPLATSLLETQSIEVNDLSALQNCLLQAHTREGLEQQMFEVLFGEHFAKEADEPNMDVRIQALVKKLSSMMTVLPDFKLFAKRVRSLLPETMKEINDDALQRIKERYYGMQRDTQRKRMAADVEIRLRNIYYDRIERTMVNDVLDAIYKHVLSLEDIEFLVKYASLLLPPKPEMALSGELIMNNILELQSQLTAKREAAVVTLTTAISQLYPEQLPALLRQKAEEVAVLYRKERFATKREINSLSQIAAESGKLFPPDFAAVVPHDVLLQANALFHNK